MGRPTTSCRTGPRPLPPVPDVPGGRGGHGVEAAAAVAPLRRHARATGGGRRPAILIWADAVNACGEDGPRGGAVGGHARRGVGGEPGGWVWPPCWRPALPAGRGSAPERRAPIGRCRPGLSPA